MTGDTFHCCPLCEERAVYAACDCGGRIAAYCPDCGDRIRYWAAAGEGGSVLAECRCPDIGEGQAMEFFGEWSEVVLAAVDRRKAYCGGYGLELEAGR